MKSASFSSSDSSTSSSAESPTMSSSGSFSASSHAQDTLQPNSSDGASANHDTPHQPPLSPSSARGHAPSAPTEDGEGESYERSFWANIFDEGVMVENLLEDEAMDEDEETKPSANEHAAPHRDGNDIDATPSSALLEHHWGNYDDPMASSIAEFATPPSTAMSSATPSAALYSHAYHASLGAGVSDHDGHSVFGASYSAHNHKPASGTFALSVSFEKQSNGAPFALSKPIVRDDGVLIVGTEHVDDSAEGTHDQNRIFVTNINSADPAQTAASILVEAEVRDLHWMNHQTAIAAIGKDIHLIRVGASGGNPPCQLQPAIPSVHSDAIRELAVPASSSHVLSGGFDETVVLTDLRRGGDPSASSIVSKFDAHDVVSSLRWSPDETHISWTTDGGDFQIGDVRTRSPQLQVPLDNYLHVDRMGGLFTHEYLNAHKVVLGFEKNHLVFLDIRMPRSSCCYAVSKSPMGTTGEIRRSRTNQFVVFGLGGFAIADLTHNSKSQEVLKITQFSQPPSPAYKTSGDFSYNSNSFLAVSDNAGVVTLYGSRMPAAASNASIQKEAWKEERTV